ncbi:MAG: hypothetical protein KA319_08200 [Ferruginibacter sp.]|nr:hypothetical protein [Ferruginibacter sp.]
MKKTPQLLFFLLVIINSLTHGQTKISYDKIIKKDYQIVECNVTKIADKFIEYNLPNETLIYSLEIEKIARIDFASGKSKTYLTEPIATAPIKGNPDILTYQGVVNEQPIQENTLAILPVPFDNTDNNGSSESMAKLAQNDIYSSVLDRINKIYPVTVQDIRTTNSLLRKANINFRNVDEVPVEELQKILGVDNILALKVSYTIDQVNSTTIQNSESTSIDKKIITFDDFVSIDNSVEKFYDFMVYFDVYKNSKKVYSKSRKPFLSLKDSWIDAVNYLFKKSPLYK